MKNSVKANSRGAMKYIKKEIYENKPQKKKTVISEEPNTEGKKTVIKDKNLPDNVKTAPKPEKLTVIKDENSIDNSNSVIKKVKVFDEDNDDDTFENEDIETDESSGKYIKKSVKASGFSSYFVNSLLKTKEFYLENKSQLRIFYSVLTGLFCVFLCIIVVFTFTYNNNYNRLQQYSATLSEKEDALTQENMKYFKDILQNPSLFTILDSNRYLENYLFTYKLIVSYGNTKQTYTSIKDNYFLNVPIYSGNRVTVEFVETYTPLARKILAADTLKLYSLFVSPIKNAENNWTLRDYRTFLTLDASYYNYMGDDGETPNFSVSANVTDNSNSYVITIDNFIEQEDGSLSSINFEINVDVSDSANFLKGDYRKLTTSDAVYPMTNNPFRLNLATNSASETEQILQLLNSYNTNVSENPVTASDFYDYTINTPTKGYFENIINAAIANKDSYTSILNIIGSEEKLYLEQLLNPEEIKSIAAVAHTKIDEIIDNLLSLPSDIDWFSQYQLNPDAMNELQKHSLLLYQTSALINKAFGLNYSLNAEERITAAEIKDIDVSSDYQLTESQRQLIEKLLNNYSDENIYKISLAFYKLKSLIKNFDFPDKTNISLISIRRAVNE